MSAVHNQATGQTRSGKDRPDSQRQAEASQFIDLIPGSYHQTYLNSQQEEPPVTDCKSPTCVL